MWPTDVISSFVSIVSFSLLSPCPSDRFILSIQFISTHQFFIQVNPQKHPGKLLEVFRVPSRGITTRGGTNIRERTWLVGEWIHLTAPEYQRFLPSVPKTLGTHQCLLTPSRVERTLMSYSNTRCPHGQWITEHLIEEEGKMSENGVWSCLVLTS
jgi:hypothetical protein